MMQEEFFSLLLEEKKNGKTVFLSSHILSEVEKVCDRVGIIRKGKLIYSEDVGICRSRLGKTVTVRPSGPPEESFQRIKSLTGTEGAVLRNGRIGFYYSGNLKELLQFISRIDVDDFTCETPRIEDVFFRFYKDE
jgi:ABC-2 type transport system ATP-binding protein